MDQTTSRLRLHLPKIPFFADKSSQELANIQGETVEYPADQVIFLEGEVADAFYIILEGQVQIFSYDEAGDSVVLARHTKGDFFGEKAACPSTNPVRTASARTLKKAILYKIPRKQSNACLGVYKKTLTL